MDTEPSHNRSGNQVHNYCFWQWGPKKDWILGIILYRSIRYLLGVFRGQSYRCITETGAPPTLGPQNGPQDILFHRLQISTVPTSFLADTESSHK